MSIRTRGKIELIRGKTKPTRDSRENKTNWFPEASCLSLMLYSFMKKKTSNPAICHATFHLVSITCCNVSRAGYIA